MLLHIVLRLWGQIYSYRPNVSPGYSPGLPELVNLAFFIDVVGIQNFQRNAKQNFGLFVAFLHVCQFSLKMQVFLQFPQKTTENAYFLNQVSH